MRAIVLVLSLLLTVVAVAPDAAAQDVSARDRVRRAIERFEAALGTSDPEARRQALEAALAELDEANRLESEILIEWNLARVEQELGRPVRALEHVERFLAGVPADHPRHAEAEALAAALRPRVALLWVESQVAGARVLIEGEVRATTPMAAAIRVAAGEVMVEVSAPGYQTASRRVRLAGETESHVRIELELEATALGEVRIHSRLLDVQITIDGEIRGTTPLSGTAALTPGSHELIAERPGYRRLRRTIDVELGTEQTIEVDLEPDEGAPLGVVRLRLPTAVGELDVDGEEAELDDVLDDGLELPVGRHALSLDLEQREDWEGLVEVRIGEQELAPDLRWEDAVFARLHDNAEIQRIAGGVTIGVGSTLLVTGIVALVAVPVITADRAGVVAERDACIADLFCPATVIERLQFRLDGMALSETIALGIGIPSVIVGAIALPIGIWLFVDAPSDDRIRSAAHARLGVGPSGLTVSGAF